MHDHILVVTRHPGALEWLEHQGIKPASHLTRIRSMSQIAGRNVIGILPLHYAIHTANFGRIHIPLLPDDKVGSELTYEEMLQYRARIHWYKMSRLCGEGGPFYQKALEEMCWTELHFANQKLYSTHQKSRQTEQP